MPPEIENNECQDVPMSSWEESQLPIDEKRAQELDQYYCPSESSSLRLTERDTALPAHMQLIAWRLDMQRAMMSLINRDTQYYVAECTKTMELHNPKKYEEPTDEALALDLSNPKTGSLCSETIKTKEGPNGEPAYFEVCDLAADPRYCNLSFVKNHLRIIYYCGVPVRTSNNIIIGSVFVLDHQRRKPLELKYIKFLAAMADNVMVHLETRKERMNISRIMQMNKSLAEFVNSNHEEAFPEGSGPSTSTKPNPSTIPREAQTEKSSPEPGMVDMDAKESTSRRGSTSRSTPPSNASDDDMPKENDGRDYTQILSRASVLLQQAMTLEADGGVLFFDTAATSASRGGTDVPLPSNGSKKRSQKPTLEVGSPLSRTPSQESPNEEACHDVSALLASSVAGTSFGTSATMCSIEGHVPSNIPVKLLNKFVKKSPMGRIWHYPELRWKDNVSSSTTGRPRKGTEEDELRKLFMHLPGARQLVLVPFWNTHLSRWSACLVYSLSVKREFSFEVDYCFCRAFCNCVQAEIDGYTVVASDQQKAGFISSVSHELRSPLHGILASCELLQETETTAFQSSLIDTSESCAHTLLDVINMVLDYSKINAFTRDQSTQNSHGKTPVVHDGTEPILSVYSNVNVAAISEEVIEGVVTGHLARSGTRDPHPEHPKNEPSGPQDLRQLPMSPVEIILDVRPPRDWTFTVQVGAFRRILMNLFGNSLKYTKLGFIKVSLSYQPMDIHPSEPPKAMVSLIVTDSGIGISQSYMEHKIFTPFAQENALSPGIGLGLSLVHSLVETLGGTIKIQSKVNQGTCVTVEIPMKRANAETPGNSFHNTSDENIQSLRQIEIKPRVMILGLESLTGDVPRVASQGLSEGSSQDPQERGEFYQMQDHALSSYSCGWYCFKAVRAWAPDTSPDIVFADEAHLPKIIRHLHDFDASNAILIVLCSNRSHTTAIEKSVLYPRLHVVPKPFGPFKLAKVLRQALQKHHPSQIPEASPTSEHGKQPTVHEKETLAAPLIKSRISVASLHEKPSVRPKLRTLNQNRSTGHDKAFPFPTMTVTPASRPSTSPIPTDSPQTGVVEAHQQRCKRLDVSLSHQAQREQHGEPTRSLSDSDLTRLQMNVKPRILLANDNEVNLKLLHTYLVRREYTDVTLTRDGSQAAESYLEALKNGNPFHVIFMDISMPIMDGFEATRVIRKMENTVPAEGQKSNTLHESLVVAITGNASATDQSKASSNGLDLYMTKPVSLKDVGALMKLWQETAGVHGVELARDKLLEACGSTE